LDQQGAGGSRGDACDRAADVALFSAATGEVLWATDYDTADFPGMRGVLANDDTVFVTFASHWGGGD
jgi:hypothetical protein